jgi:MFS family permease
MTATLPPATAPAQAITPRAWRVLVVTSLGVFLVLLDTTIINIAFPAITAGRTADQLGRRRMFLVGLAVFAATSAACGLAPTLPALVAGRALQAVGAALLVPTSLALLLAEFPRRRRSMAVGLWGAVGAAAATARPTRGGDQLRLLVRRRPLPRTGVLRLHRPGSARPG